MTLDEWLQKTGTTHVAFAKEINVEPVSISRYLGGRRPTWSVIEAIHHATRGKVTANDWLFHEPKKRRGTNG